MSPDRKRGSDYDVDWPESEDPPAPADTPPPTLTWRDAPEGPHPVAAGASRKQADRARATAPDAAGPGTPKLRIRVRDTAAPGSDDVAARSEVAELKELVAELRAEIAMLRRQLDDD